MFGGRGVSVDKGSVHLVLCFIEGSSERNMLYLESETGVYMRPRFILFLSKTDLSLRNFHVCDRLEGLPGSSRDASVSSRSLNEAVYNLYRQEGLTFRQGKGDKKRSYGNIDNDRLQR